MKTTTWNVSSQPGGIDGMLWIALTGWTFFFLAMIANWLLGEKYLNLRQRYRLLSSWQPVRAKREDDSN